MAQKLSREQVKEKIVAIVAEQLGKSSDDLGEEKRFLEDLNADSLDTVELVMECEDAFEMDIPDEAAKELLTVGSLIKFVTDNQGKKAPAAA